MPQKRNPWNSEHVKSLWKAFMPRVITFFMDQVSEHQRDLSKSASQRFIADYIAGFALAVSRMAEVIRGLGVDRERLLANLKAGAGGALLAEPAYILLAESGVSDAHEVIRKITLALEEKEMRFAQVLAEEKETLSKIAAKMIELGLISPNGTSGADEAALEWFSKPEQYRGLAVKKARDIAAKYKSIVR
jgi:adenylosuccinate lyase